MRRSLIPVLLLACACEPPAPPPPGYTGPLPGQGQTVVQDLFGKTLVDAAGELGGGTWTVGPFMVGPSGPFVPLRQNAVERTIWLFSDADVADLYRRVTGSPHPSLTGTPTDGYRRSWRK